MQNSHSMKGNRNGMSAVKFHPQRLKVVQISGSPAHFKAKNTHFDRRASFEAQNASIEPPRFDRSSALRQATFRPFWLPFRFTLFKKPCEIFDLLSISFRKPNELYGFPSISLRKPCEIRGFRSISFMKPGKIFGFLSISLGRPYEITVS